MWFGLPAKSGDLFLKYVFIKYYFMPSDWSWSSNSRGVQTALLWARERHGWGLIGPHK